VSFVSRADRREKLRRKCSSARLVSMELVVESSAGEEIIRCGGVWDSGDQRYVSCPSKFSHTPAVIRCQQSQDAAMRAMARWILQCRKGERKRARVIILGGKPGSGKTFLLMVFHALCALEWPEDVQFCSNLNSDNRRECLDALAHFAPAAWYGEERDPRNPCLEFRNGHVLSWSSARNSKKLRQRGLPIRTVGINEAQDQGEELYAIAQKAPRKRGGVVVATMNPPTNAGGNWTARLWLGIEAGDVRGEIFEMDTAGNAAIDHDFDGDAGQAIRVAAPRMVAAHVDGSIRQAGSSAYASFDARPYNQVDPLAGGCVGDVPRSDIGPPQWVDVTREITAAAMGSPRGADYVIGCDFQVHPGCCATPAKFYRRGGELVLHIERVISVRGQEDALSQALIDAGFTSNGFRNDGTQGPIALLVGDATGDRQSADHRGRPPSFWAMQANGWRIIAPAIHHKKGTPWWPPVLESLDQCFTLFERRQIVVGLECKKPSEALPSLVESFRNALRNEWSGKLKKGEVFQHAPDCVRYLAWWGLPRPKATPISTTPDLSIFAATKRRNPG